MQLADLLTRLSKVKQTGAGDYVALCPAHDDRDPSLTIADRDGTILMHCWAGCDVESIANAVGVELSDLFPPKESTHTGKRLRFNPIDVSKAVAHEALVVAICAASVGRGEALSADDSRRLAVATARLTDAAEAVRWA